MRDAQIKPHFAFEDGFWTVFAGERAYLTHSSFHRLAERVARISPFTWNRIAGGDVAAVTKKWREIDAPIHFSGRLRSVRGDRESL